jgi:anionic cell wall polymer biosynthesis LytR-Cps2A-Psr (LCP) family protein
MTDISLCDEEGNNLGTLNAQICVQHAFGDGKRLSCLRSVDVVEKLFGNIPISGYLAMNMGAIPAMNDAIGGVTLTVQDDVSFPDSGVELREGETVQLDGTEAYYYLHGRDTNVYDSATQRLRREEQYIMAYMDKLKVQAQGDSNVVVDVYDRIADYLVTSVDFTSLITSLLEYDFTEDAMYTVPGETELGEPIDGERYAEYYVDEAAMQDLIMQVFYEPVD